MKYFPQFYHGIKAPFAGLRLILRHRQLQSRVAIPLVLSLCILVAVIIGGAHFLPPIKQLMVDATTYRINAWLGTGASNVVFVYLWKAVMWILTIIFYLLSASLLFILSWLLSNLMCSFFWESLAEQTLKLHPTWPTQPGHKMSAPFLLVIMTRELFKETGLIVITVFFAIVGFLPVVGPPFSLIFGPIVVSLLLGFTCVDYGMSALAMPIKERLAWAKDHWAFLIGLGIYGLFFPVVFLFYPAFIVGALYKYPLPIPGSNHDSLVKPVDERE